MANIKLFVLSFGVGCLLLASGCGHSNRPESPDLLNVATGFHGDASGEKDISSDAAATNSWSTSPQRINLLQQYQFPRDVERGNWREEDGALISMPARPSLIKFDTQLPAEYRLRAVVRRIGGRDGFEVGVSHGGHQARVVFDGYDGETSGLQFIDGAAVPSNETCYRGKVIPDGRRAIEITVDVSAEGVTAYADGKSIVRWRGDWKRLSIDPSQTTSLNYQTWLASWASSYQIDEFEAITGVVLHRAPSPNHRQNHSAHPVSNLANSSTRSHVVNPGERSNTATQHVGVSHEVSGAPVGVKPVTTPDTSLPPIHPFLTVTFPSATRLAQDIGDLRRLATGFGMIGKQVRASASSIDRFLHTLFAFQQDRPLGMAAYYVNGQVEWALFVPLVDRHHIKQLHTAIAHSRDRDTFGMIQLPEFARGLTRQQSIPIWVQHHDDYALLLTSHANQRANFQLPNLQSGANSDVTIQFSMADEVAAVKTAMAMHAKLTRSNPSLLPIASSSSLLIRNLETMKIEINFDNQGGDCSLKIAQSVRDRSDGDRLLSNFKVASSPMAWMTNVPKSSYAITSFQLTPNVLERVGNLFGVEVKSIPDIARSFSGAASDSGASVTFDQLAIETLFQQLNDGRFGLGTVIMPHGRSASYVRVDHGEEQIQRLKQAIAKGGMAKISEFQMEDFRCLQVNTGKAKELVFAYKEPHLVVAFAEPSALKPMLTSALRRVRQAPPAPTTPRLDLQVDLGQMMRDAQEMRSGSLATQLGSSAKTAEAIAELEEARFNATVEIDGRNVSLELSLSADLLRFFAGK